MIKVLKGNQIIIIVIAIMLVTVGYLNYSTNLEEKDYVAVSSNESIKEGIGDAKLVNSDSTVDEYAYTEALVENETKESDGDAILTNSENEKIAINQNELENKDIADDYFASSRLERENMYSQMLETYKKMCESSSVSAEQKAIASNEITKITNTKNAIMISENLIKTKGFEDVVVFVNNDSINVVVKSEELSKEQVAQLQNIISREMEVNIQNIHISNK